MHLYIVLKIHFNVRNGLLLGIIGLKKGIKVYGAYANLHVAQLVGITCVRTSREVFYAVARKPRAFRYRSRAALCHH